MDLQRYTLQSTKTPTLRFKPLTKQNHNVSCILYKPQRLRISSLPPGTPKQPPYLVRRMIPETLQNLPGKTATIPVPTDFLKLKISQIFQISQSLHRFTTSPESPSLRYSTIPSIKTSRHLTAPLFQCFSQSSISAGETRISHQNTRKCHKNPETNNQNPSQKQMHPLFVLLNVKSCHTQLPPQDLTFSTLIP